MHIITMLYFSTEIIFTFLPFIYYKKTIQMGRLDGKIIVITAAANGIGRASALAFHAEGAIVYASDVDLVKLREIEQPGRLICNKLDVTDKNAIEEYAKSIEKVDVLFNVAG